MEIILTLVNGKNHLREIARQIEESHSTILRKINELLLENVLDYEISGKNKIFFLKKNLKSRNYVYSAELYKLSQFLNKNPEVGIIIEDLKKNISSEIVLLFGSYAKGIAKSNSDIDIYLETNNINLKKRLEELNSQLSIKIGKFDKTSLLIKEIIKNHVIINGFEEYYEKVGFFEEN
jgi:predicted nucleotidyltransferase